MNINTDDSQYKTIKACQHKHIKDNGSRPTVAVLCVDGRPWMHRITKQATNSDHNWISYIIMWQKLADL